ncbi:MAG: DUF2442 domain-containing protein [Alphaproteobacteria bacterium]
MTVAATAGISLSPTRGENWDQGLHWDALDEDISIAGLLAGRGDQTVKPKEVA